MKGRMKRLTAVLLSASMALPMAPGMTVLAKEPAGRTEAFEAGSTGISADREALSGALTGLLDEEDLEAALAGGEDLVIFANGVSEDGQSENGQSENQPGQSENAPGQSENDPGQSENEPGQSENEPGQSENQPGQSENQPGQSENQPGQSENEPGQSENQPGQSENEPGQSENQPGESENDPGETEDWGRVNPEHLKRWLNKKDVTIADIPKGFWGCVDDYAFYNGTPWEPTEYDGDLYVYYGKTVLAQDWDYTVKYSNNKNAGEAEVLVTAKGNYSGKVTIPFIIKPASMKWCPASDIYVPYTGKVQKPKPVIKSYLNTKLVTLKENKDYELVYDAASEEGKGTPYQDPGVWKITVKGKGNYDETAETFVTIGAKEAKDIKKAKVTGVKKSYPYEKFDFDKDLGPGSLPELDNAFKVTVDGEELTANTRGGEGANMVNGDFGYRYEVDNVTGKAELVIYGTNSYTGEKRVKFNLQKINIKGLTATLDPQPMTYRGGYMYTGAPAVTSIRIGEETISGNDIIENFERTGNLYNKAGKGKWTITAAPYSKYTGKATVPYTIEKFDISKVEDKYFYLYGNGQVEGKDRTFYYQKDGVTPLVEIYIYQNEEVIGDYAPNYDYTLKYSENKVVGKAKVTLKGKGSCTGTKTLEFDIVKSNAGNVFAEAADVIVKNGEGLCKPKITVRDTNNRKVLKAGTDYSKNITYTYTDAKGEKAEATEKTKLPAGTWVEAEITLVNENYISETEQGKENKIYTSFRIVDSKNDISKATVKIDPIPYRGEDQYLTASDFTVKLGDKTLDMDTDFSIDSGSWFEKPGTYTMVLQGIGQYGGSKSVKFKVVAAK